MVLKVFFIFLDEDKFVDELIVMFCSKYEFEGREFIVGEIVIKKCLILVFK